MSAPSSPEAQNPEQDFSRLRSPEEQRAWMEERGIHNPFFNIHEGIAGATTRIDGRDFINFASYNYAGLSGDPRVSAASKDAIDRFGTSVSASRIVSGERPLHGQLEAALARFLHTEDALTFVSGHLTNLTVIGDLVGPNDLVLHDSTIHNSAMLGCRLSGAFCLSHPHNDYDTLEALLEKHRPRHRRALILTEGVYSMDGDIPDLPRLVELRRKHGTQLMVDEAHSCGVLGKTGRGIGEHFDVNPEDVDLWMGTLSKVFASCGGYVAGKRELIDRLRVFNPGIMFSVGLPPSSAGAALRALECLEAEPERVERLRERAELFRTLARQKGWNIGEGAGSAIVPLILGDSERCLRLSDGLYKAGINVLPIVFPAVALDQARLRFFFSANHSEEQIRFTIAALAGLMAPPAARVETEPVPNQDTTSTTMSETDGEKRAARCRELLQGFPEDTILHAVRFMETRDPNSLDRLILGILLYYLPASPSGKPDVAALPRSTELVRDLSFDSLAAVEMSFMIQDLFSVKIADQELAALRSIGDLLTLVRGKLIKS